MRLLRVSLLFHHHAILVSDLEKAEAFYGGVLGLGIKKRWFDEDDQARSIWFELGETNFLAVELHGADAAAPADRPDGGHHCFALGIQPSEREYWLSRLAAAQVTMEKQSEFSLYFRDPEHNQIALSHWPQQQKRSKPSG